jgi:hypothetical protein
VYCPRCGTQNEEGDRFCVSCGANLRKPPKPDEQRSLRERLQGLIGTTPRARALSLGTAAAVVIAIVAFIAIPAAKDAPDDPFTVSADQICVQSKQAIAAVEQHVPPAAGPGVFATDLVPIVAGWRFRFNRLPLPDDKVEKAAQLDLALRNMEIQAGALSRAAAEGNTSQELSLARSGDQAAARVEGAIDDLDLPTCRDLAVGLVRVPPSRQ